MNALKYLAPLVLAASSLFPTFAHAATVEAPAPVATKSAVKCSPNEGSREERPEMRPEGRREDRREDRREFRREEARFDRNHGRPEFHRNDNMQRDVRW